MADISIDEIKRLRELTGVGITDAKAALVEANGDFDKALSAMRKKGLTKAEKRGEREARAGLVGTYNHDGRIGVLVEVNCETDFVAKTDEFKDLVKDLAMHIAASSPLFVSADDVPAEEKDKQAAEFSEKVKAEGKPEKMVPQIRARHAEKTFCRACFARTAIRKKPRPNSWRRSKRSQRQAWREYFSPPLFPHRYRRNRIVFN
jgi:elongation factor Ts